MDEAPHELEIDRLWKGSRLERSVGLMIRDGARVALDRAGLTSPQVFRVKRRDVDEARGIVRWRKTRGRTRDNFQPKRAAECAGECLALASLKAIDNLVFYARSEEGSGADAILRPPGGTYEQGVVVEWSGCVEGDVRDLHDRLRLKVHQVRETSPRSRMLPARAVVVGVRERLILSQDVPLSEDAA